MINLYPYICAYGMFIYIPICMYIYLHIYAYACISIHMCVCVCIHMCIHAFFMLVDNDSK